MSGDEQHKNQNNQDYETMKRKYEALLADSEMMRAKVTELLIHYYFKAAV